MPGLPGDERDRYDRYRIDGKKNEYLLGKLLTRLALSRHDPRPPGSWRFKAARRGKPAIDDPHCPLRFNLSHTSGCLAVAVANRCAVGLDVEEIQERDPGVPRRFFASAEADLVEARSSARTADGNPSPRASLFATFWTLKEAYLKVCGDGLYRALDSFCFDPDPPATITFLSGRMEDPARYWFHHEVVLPGIALAVAVRTLRRPVTLISHTLTVEELLEVGDEPSARRISQITAVK